MMVISNLNIKLLEDRLGFINEAVQRLRRLSGYTEEEFLRDDNPAIAESYLRRSLEAIFDIGRHITAMARFRNLLVHVYWKVHFEKVWDILQYRLHDLHHFSQAIASLAP